MVWINEICWHEMNVNDELTLVRSIPGRASRSRICGERSTSGGICPAI